MPRKAKKEKEQKSNSKLPQFMVQVSDPIMLRKDILEALRDVIIFMQGYERFKLIQDEKVGLYSKLQLEVKELNSMINTKLRKILPKGKLKSVHQAAVPKQVKIPESRVPVVTPSKGQPIPPPTPGQAPAPPLPPAASAQPTELDALESQLNSIENQLKGLN